MERGRVLPVEDNELSAVEANQAAGGADPEKMIGCLRECLSPAARRGRGKPTAGDSPGPARMWANEAQFACRTVLLVVF